MDTQILRVYGMHISSPTGYGLYLVGGNLDHVYDGLFIEAATEDGVKFEVYLLTAYT